MPIDSKIFGRETCRYTSTGWVGFGLANNGRYHKRSTLTAFQFYISHQCMTTAKKYHDVHHPCVTLLQRTLAFHQRIDGIVVHCDVAQHCPTLQYNDLMFLFRYQN